MITDITVSPTHRRRGLLRRLITDDLQDAVDRGVPLAALTVSEGSIYGRFGFGPATHVQHVEVDTTARFALREPVDEAAPGGSSWSSRTRRGRPCRRSSTASTGPPVARSSARSSTGTSSPRTFDFHEQGPDRKLRAAVHLDDAGEPDGYVLYRLRPLGGHPRRSTWSTWSP